MPECPYLNTCNERVSKKHFELHCTQSVKVTKGAGFENCTYYLKKQQEEMLRTPREWKEGT